MFFSLLSFQTYSAALFTLSIEKRMKNFVCGIGYGFNVNEKLTVGARFKLLLGLANINTTNTHIDLSTDPNLNTLAVNMDYSIRMSAPLRLSVVGDTEALSDAANAIAFSALEDLLKKLQGINAIVKN